MQQVRSSMVLVSILRGERLCINSRSTNNNNNLMKMKMKQQQRWMVGKASNRSGVHGTHLPPTHSLDNVEAVEKGIEKGRKHIEAKRKQVEEAVDSHLNRSGQDAKPPAN